MNVTDGGFGVGVAEVGGDVRHGDAFAFAVGGVGVAPVVERVTLEPGRFA